MFTYVYNENFRSLHLLGDIISSSDYVAPNDGMVNEWVLKILKRWPQADLRYCPSVCQEGLRKTRGKQHKNWQLLLWPPATPQCLDKNSSVMTFKSLYIYIYIYKIITMLTKNYIILTSRKFMLRGSKTIHKWFLWKKCLNSLRQWNLSSGSASLRRRNTSNSLKPVLCLHTQNIHNYKTISAWKNSNKLQLSNQQQSTYILCGVYLRKLLGIGTTGYEMVWWYRKMGHKQCEKMWSQPNLRYYHCI